MKTLFLCALLLAPPGGDREKGVQLYAAGKYAEAAEAFRAAIAAEGDLPELHYNLALASWRAGRLADAETAVEKYAAMAGDARAELHGGVLGAVRYDEAKLLERRADELQAAAAAPPAVQGQPAPAAEDPLAVLEQALQKAGQAKEHFVRGATTSSSPELLRNTERTLRLVDELQKKIDELKRQREQQKKDQEQKDSEQKDQKDQKDEKGEQKKQDDKQDGKQGEKPPDEQPPDKGEPKPEQPEGQQGEQPPEPKPGEQPPEGQKADEQKSPAQPDTEKAEPKPADAEQQQRDDAPGEQQAGKQLSPERTLRLLEDLRDLDLKLRDYRVRAGKTTRRTVARDW
ncbi:MAG: tetratricopeptide repeat protein [Planctomycetes bacterium]|nr:tetratricopeptide repeat protein [Planctomycetota bacterium]